MVLVDYAKKNGCNSFAVTLRDKATNRCGRVLSLAEMSLAPRRKRERLSTLPFSLSIDQADYTQVITPLLIEQTFADCE